MQPAPVKESTIQQMHDLSHCFGALDANSWKNINEDELSFVCSLFAVELPKKLWWINVNKAPAFTQ